MKKKLLNLAVVVGSMLLAPLALADAMRVLTSLPVTHGLGSALLQGTKVQVVRATPAKLPASRQISYFSGRGAGALEKAASSADAVIAMRSLWPDDPLYPMARRSNIRIVEVDAARPVDGALPGIALRSEGGDVLAQQPWLSINNLGRMADVMAADLARLSPDDAAQIASNLADIKQRLLTLSATSESRLAELDNLSVASLSPGFEYLTTGLNLDVIELSADPAVDAFKSVIEDNDVRLVLSDRAVDETVAAAVKDAGARLLMLDDSAGDPVNGLVALTEQIIDGLSAAQDTD
ncbi:metal ABC transporter solute-binding protein, Zn/Mn family [Pseudomonas sp. UBA6323]|uniref:metal ABC transporter solute-binding protein, Zn/Mn family n=1 Tax=Pseudomonas sp. UBA6323 TaxID=1947329 RepID=UPI0025D23D61|nr:zinc ABC transporter substrate-binding protein [Pseudomonas sp. UBA6323]